MRPSFIHPGSFWRHWLMLLSVAWTILLPAQQVSVSLMADSTHLLIGDHLKIRLSVTHDKSIKVAVPEFRETLGQLDIVQAGPYDTAAINNDIILSRVFTVSAFDSGTFTAGPVPVLFQGAAGIDTAVSNTLEIFCNTLSVDTAKPFKPIKAPLKVPYLWQEFLYYLIAAVFLLLLGIALYLMWRQQKHKKVLSNERPVPKDPPHIWARKELKKLEEEKLWQQDKVKEYYSRMTDILRLYLEYRYRWYALEATTEEIETQLSQYPVNDIARDLLMKTLRSADLVKFAKMLPLPDVNTRSMQQAYDFIEVTKQTEENPGEKK